MYRCDIILSFQTVGDKSICTLDTINEVASSLDHTLIDKLSERLRLTHVPEVVEELVPEP